MKCPSIACLYPSSTTTPFPSSSHLITAALILPSPPSLFTASSDGSILFWSLFNPTIRPISILCGHSSPVTALAVAFNHHLLFSASSSDSLLCAWSASSPYRCRLRRHLPPSSGSISQMLASPLQHLCVLTTSSVLLVDSSTLDIVQTVAEGIRVASLAFRSDREAVMVNSRGRVSRMALEAAVEGQEGPVWIQR